MEINLPEKRYYNIGEIAKAFNVNTSLIRFWEKEFDILNPMKNDVGNRKFTVKDIDALKIIYNLVKEKGFTLEGAKHKIKEEKDTFKKNAEIVSKLNHIKSQLLELKANLNKN